MIDPVKNFAIVTVDTGYDADDVSIDLSSGHGAKLPDPATEGEYNAVWWNSTDYPNPADDPNVEIVRVMAISTDTLTILRAQEGTTASTKNTGGKTYKMILALTKEVQEKNGNRTYQARKDSAEVFLNNVWSINVATGIDINRGIWVEELGLFVFVGDSGAYTSPDGVNWTMRDEHETGVNYAAVAYSPSLNLLVAVCTEGTDRVATSADGVTWAGETAASQDTWVDVIWVPELALFVAVSGDASPTYRFMTSPDGETWTGHNPTEDEWVGSRLAWSPELGIIVAVGAGSGDDIAVSSMWSTDGSTWTAVSDGEVDSTNTAYGVAWSPHLRMFAMLGWWAGGETSVLAVSKTGKAWTQIPTAQIENIDETYDIIWAQELSCFVLAGSSGVTISHDGYHWKNLEQATNLGLVNSIAWSPTLGKLTTSYTLGFKTSYTPAEVSRRTVMHQGNALGEDLYVGTNDSRYFVFKTNGNNRGWFHPSGGFYVVSQISVGDTGFIGAFRATTNSNTRNAYTDSIAQFAGSDSDDNHILIDTANSPAYTLFRHSTGTMQTPVASQAGNFIGGLRFYGYDGDTFDLGAQMIAAVPSGDPLSDTNHGMEFWWYTTARNTTTFSAKMVLESFGRLGIGDTSPISLLEVAGAFNALTDTSQGVNYLQILRHNAATNGAGAGLAFSVTNTDNNIGAAIIHERVAGNSQGNLKFYTKRDTTAGGGPTLSMTIEDTGDVTFEEDTYITGNSVSHIALNEQTGTTYTLALADDGKLIDMDNAAGITLTVPPNGTIAFPIGTKILIRQTDVGAITIEGDTGVTVVSSVGYTTTGEGAVAGLIKVGTDEWALFGDLELIGS